MDIVCSISVIAVSSLLLLFGLLGCVIPVIPGPILSYAAMLVLLPTRFVSFIECIVYGVACLLVVVLDYVVPAFSAKKFNCSRYGVIGCVIGTVIGIFYGFSGLLLGPFLGAMAGELLSGKRFVSSMKGGFGAFLGFLFGVLIKVVYCAVCAGWCISSFFTKY